MESKVSVEMNQDLIKQFTKEEVEVALKQMHPTEAPSPNGMSAVFYQNFWDFVGNDVVNMVLNVLNFDRSMADIKWNFHNKKTTDHLNGRNTSPSLPLA